MRAPNPFAFMHWAKTWQGNVPLDLGASGVSSPDPEEFPPAPSEYSGPNYFGTRELRDAIAAVHGVSRKAVVVSDGASLANYTALTSLAGPGDRVLVERPTYAALHEIPRFHGAEVLRLERRPGDGWVPRLEDVERAAAGGLSAVVLTRLHNPSGVDLPASFLEGLAGLAREGRFHVLFDEVYLDFLPDAAPAHTLSERFLTVGSLTKSYGFGGLRVGWIVGDPKVLEPMKELSLYLAVDGSRGAQATAVRVLESRERFLQRARGLAAAGRAVLEQWIAGRDDVEWVEPAGGVCAFLRLPTVKDTAGLAAALREEDGVNVAEGEHFGCPGWVRVGFGVEPSTLREALARIERRL